MLSSTNTLVISFNALAAAQREDMKLHRLHSATCLLIFCKVPPPRANTTLMCDILTGQSHPFITVLFHHTVFNAFHPLVHPIIRATQRLITTCYIWPLINTGVSHWAKQRLQGQRSNIQRRTVTPLGSFSTPDWHFDKVHMDLVASQPPSNGHRYLLACVDHWL